jgi:hypothetical protein
VPFRWNHHCLSRPRRIGSMTVCSAKSSMCQA